MGTAHPHGTTCPLFPWLPGWMVPELRGALCVELAKVDSMSCARPQQTSFYASVVEGLRRVLHHDQMKHACAELLKNSLSGKVPTAWTNAQTIAFELLYLTTMVYAPGATAAQAKAEVKKYPAEADMILSLPAFVRAGRNGTQDARVRRAALLLTHLHRDWYRTDLYGVTASELVAVFDLPDDLDRNTVRDWVKAGIGTA
jgi:hypothetical protein